MYKVIKFFTDLHDKDHPYSVGDTFPRAGITVTEKRIAELAGSKNRQGTPLIEEVADASEAMEPMLEAMHAAEPEEVVQDAEGVEESSMEPADSTKKTGKGRKKAAE